VSLFDSPRDEREEGFSEKGEKPAEDKNPRQENTTSATLVVYTSILWKVVL
jgi:hypothetical protein